MFFGAISGEEKTEILLQIIAFYFVLILFLFYTMQ